jgi:putative sterol carrier protein
MTTEQRRPVFGEVSLYEAMADRLNADPSWAGIGSAITYSMTYHFEEPVDRAFHVVFDAGRVTEITEVESSSARPADFVISGKPEAWKAVLRSETKPTVAIATGKLKVQGRQLTLLKHMEAFSYILKVMTELDPQYD